MEQPLQAEGTPIAERLRAARLAANKAQQEIAGGRFSKSYISAIERGKMTPSVQALDYLAGLKATPSRTRRERTIANFWRLLGGMKQPSTCYRPQRGITPYRDPRPVPSGQRRGASRRASPGAALRKGYAVLPRLPACPPTLPMRE
jgi:transcriptional regulator with XRE-family HTH domain